MFFLLVEVRRRAECARRLLPNLDRLMTVPRPRRSQFLHGARASCAAIHGLMLEELPAATRSLRVALVSETWPPEVNGVAKTAARFAEGLRERGHRIALVRPRQGAGDEAAPGDTLMRGIAI